MNNKSILPPTALRVKLHTRQKVNKQIEQVTRYNVMKYGHSAEQIDRRIDDLKYEWDTERTLETNASIIIVGSLLLGYFIHPLWLVLTGVVALFLLQHALQGWCPPLPLIRKLGVRTAWEIDQEITALKIMKGIYHPVKDPQEALELVKDRN